MGRCRHARIMEGKILRGATCREDCDLLARLFPAVYVESELCPAELDLAADPCESEFGADAFEEIVFDDAKYDSLCIDLRGRRLWDSAEEESEP